LRTGFGRSIVFAIGLGRSITVDKRPLPLRMPPSKRCTNSYPVVQQRPMARRSSEPRFRSLDVLVCRLSCGGIRVVCSVLGCLWNRLLCMSAGLMDTPNRS
jgi:hypothetical protein